MITFDQMVKKLGKDRAIHEVSHCRRNGLTGHDRTKGIRGRIRHRKCSHGVWVIDNYEQKPCAECMGSVKGLKLREFQPYFNIGLGCWVESRSEEKRVAKSMGLTEAG